MLKAEEDFAHAWVGEGSADSATANDCLLRGVTEFWDREDFILLSFGIIILASSECVRQGAVGRQERTVLELSWRESERRKEKKEKRQVGALFLLL